MYEELTTEFNIPEDVLFEIKRCVDDLNNNKGNLQDWYRTEVDLSLKDNLNRKKITREHYKLLRDYYVLGGIKKEGG